MMKLQTRTKVTAVLGTFLTAAIAGQFFIASQVYLAAVEPVADELNDSTVQLLTASFEAWIETEVAQVKRLTGFEADDDLIAVTRFRATAEAVTWTSESLYTNAKQIQGYGLDASEIERIRKLVPVPFAKIIANTIWLFNSSRQGGMPVLSVGISLGSVDGVPQILVMDLRPDRILSQLRERKVSEGWIANQDSEVLVHSNPTYMEERKVLSLPILRALPPKAELVDQTFQIDGADWRVAAWISPRYKLRIGGQVSGSKIYDPLQMLAHRSLIWLGGVLLIAFILANRVASRIAKPNSDVRERLSKLLAESEKTERSENEVLSEIVAGWKKSFDHSGWAGLEADLRKPVTGYGTLLEEDLANLDLIVQAHLRRIDERSELRRQLQNELDALK